VVARRGEEDLVIVELKLGLSLALLYQAVDRLALSPHVYVAIARPKRGVPAAAVKLCRRLCIGLILVSGSGSVETLADPVAYSPRHNLRKRGLLLREFAARAGDPNLGGSTRTPVMTAYRQDALKCVEHLRTARQARPRDVRDATRVDRAATILRDNVYGWFQRVERGVYALSDTAPALQGDVREAA
jgi:hypothetical protein